MTSFAILYSFRRCPYAMRARLALAASGMQVQLREIILRNKPAEMLAISPKGTVPVLQCTDGTVIDESLDIMWWALRQSDPEQLLPAPEQQAELNDLIATNDGAFKWALDRYKYPPRYISEHGTLSPEQFAQFHRDQAAALLTSLDTRLQSHPYLLGARLSMADLAIAPFVRQYAHTDLDWFAAQPWPALWDWLQRFLASERFARIMHKYAPWQPQDTPILFPPAQ